MSHFIQAKAIPINVYIVLDNPEMNKEMIQEWVSKILLNTSSKIKKMDVFHSTWDTRYMDTWTIGKSIVNYVPTKMDCKYSPCDMLKGFIDDKKTQETKLFFGEGIFNCNIRDFDIGSAPFKNNADNILEKIDGEYEINKVIGKELTLIFYIPTSTNIEPPHISFENDTIQVKKGDKIQLKPIFEGKVFDFQWEPSAGLSCTNCEQPSVETNVAATYSVIAKNEQGCPSDPITVTIIPKKVCEDNFSSCSIDYFVNTNLYRNVLNDQNRWLMASSQPGSLVYYLICSPNCGTNFVVSLLDLNNHKIWEEKYLLDQVSKGQKLHVDFEDAFIFKINLNGIDFESKNFYRFEIKTVDEEKNPYPIYKSPPTKFVDCGFTE